MGFYAKLIFVTPEQKAADRATNNSSECTFWEYFGFTIDFDHITGLSKITDSEGSETRESPFRIAAICLFSTIYTPMIARSQDQRGEYFAPEIFIHNWVADAPHSDVSQTITVAGKEYLDCPQDILKGRRYYKDESIMKCHNDGIIRHNIEIDKLYLLPLIWASARDLASWVANIDEKSPKWQLLERNPIAMGIFEGWRVMLTKLGETETKVILRTT